MSVMEDNTNQVAILREETIESPGGSSLDHVIPLAVQVLLAGEVIAYPTETVYGLGSDYSSERGFRSILGMKKIEGARPFILLIPDTGWIDVLTSGDYNTRLLEKLAEAFWPGPVTLLLPAAENIPEYLAGPGGMISLRMSSTPFVNKLLEVYQRPITSTSANAAGMPPATCLVDLRAYFFSSPFPIGLAIDGGVGGVLPSTIVRIRGDEVRVVREGVVSSEKILTAMLS